MNHVDGIFVETTRDNPHNFTMTNSRFQKTITTGLIFLALPIMVYCEEAVFNLTDLKGLAKKNSEAEIYRLKIIRPFDPCLVFEIHVTKTSGEAILSIRKSVRKTKDENSSLVEEFESRKRHLSIKELASFLNLMKEGDFWRLPEKDWKDTAITSGKPFSDAIKDGSEWTLEGVKAGNYQIIRRLAPISAAVYNDFPSDIIEQYKVKRAMSEGIIISACLWMWIISGETEEEIY